MHFSRHLFFFSLFAAAVAAAADVPAKNILILTAGKTDLRNPAIGDGRQLATLLGHFTVTTTVKGVAEYRRGELETYDLTFYVGYGVRNTPPAHFLDDVLTTKKPIVWLSTGMAEFCRRPDAVRRLGFTVTGIDSVAGFDRVRVGAVVFEKGEPHLGLIRVTAPSSVQVIATAFSTTTHREFPYAVRSGNLTYFADSPFAYATPGDHYLYFADLLHDLVGENHEESHHAMIRIEDVTIYEDPAKLREIADVLSSRGIPFMVGVIPFFVDPGAGIRLSLSDKPDLVDALQYMVRNGGTIVMHGVTHQYKGVTATDFEFWDDNIGGPIRGETEEAIERKIETGIQEFMKNGLYPLVWETPHYTASFALYRTIARYFSTACEQRLALEDPDFSQFFPYVIRRDLFGQTIYPENLGYVPLGSDKKISRDAVEEIIANARAQRYVRDGIATAFFHAFLDIDLLERLVDGVEELGYTFLDMREQTHWVHANDRVILCGSQEYSVRLRDQYLLEATYDRDGEVKVRHLSQRREAGLITHRVTLEPGEFFKAEPVEYLETEPTFFEKTMTRVERMYHSIVTHDEPWQMGRITILWNHFARGAAFNDQASFASAFRSVQFPVDTSFLGEPLTFDQANVLVVPFAIADSLKPEEIAAIGRFVAEGHNLLMDARTDFAEAFGIRFTPSRLQVRGIRDRLFPEERIAWQYPELVAKFDVEKIDRVFAVDDATEAPMAVGLQYGKGRIIFLNGRFDPRSSLGTSHYPYLIEYVRRYFQVQSIVRSEQLEMYFDPGFRHSYSIENLVRSWVQNGIRIIHVAGWHEYPKYTYDYDRLIRLAHANGILVYAWLEPPQVSQKFWQEHPEWREKNIEGKDIQPSWRYPIALTDSACMKAVTEKFRHFLLAYDWDGVNLAELYFEAGRGFEDPKLFTPAHSTARSDMRRLFNLDLASVFDSTSSSYWRSNDTAREEIVQYRVQKLSAVYRTMLTCFNSIAAMKPGFDLVVTAMDSRNSPELREHIGVDMNEILRLQHEFGFVLQVEDPQSRWSATPARYADIGKEYRTLVSAPHDLMLDLNILSFRDPKSVLPYPTLIQTGTESFQLVHSASSGAPRITVYSEASVNPQDLAFFAHSLAANVRMQWDADAITVSAPHSFLLRLPNDVGEIALDGSPLMPFRDNRYFLPAGDHRIQLHPAPGGTLSPRELQTRILSATGNIVTMVYGVRDITMTYESPFRMLVSVSNSPGAVTIDGEPWSFTAFKGNDCYSLFLPPGRHTAVIVTGGEFAYGVSLTSFWSSTAIAIFGLLAVSTLLGMYALLKVLNRRAGYFHS